MNNSKRLLLELAQFGLASVHGGHLVRQAVRRYAPLTPLHLVAIGKAATAMTAGACEVLGDRIERAVLITSEAYDVGGVLDASRIELIQGGHPIPTEDSLFAGARLLEWIEATPADGRILFLISGGASSMVEVAAAGVSLRDLQRANQWLLASGLDIRAINAIRCGLSLIKGGKLLSYLGDRSAEVWLVSDVAGDDPAVIGSGLLYPVQDPVVLAAGYPGWLDQLLARAAASQGRYRQASRPRNPLHRVLGTLGCACQAVAQQAQVLGLTVHMHAQELDGDAAASGHRLGNELLTAPAGIHIWGGETTVRLPAHSGVGGRNQHLALAAAIQLSGCRDVQLLALASDGRDGPGDDAGALVNGGTIARGALSGLDASEQLQRANSGGFLEASGDLVSTGPTGTNVRDLVLAWKG